MRKNYRFSLVVWVLPSTDLHRFMLFCVISTSLNTKWCYQNILIHNKFQKTASINLNKAVIRRQFNLTLCRSDFDSAIRTMFEAEEQARRSRAQAASDALDPFHFDVDLNCEDPPNRQSGTRQAQGAEANPDDSEIP